MFLRNHLLPPFAFALVLAGLFLPSARAQVTPEQAATMLLESARRAYNEKNYPFAATKFREFLQKFGNHREVPSARLGLALSHIEGDHDHDKSIEQLQQLVGNKKSEEYPRALYYYGLSRRGQGLKSLALAAAKPAEAANHRNNARSNFEDGARQFGLAASAFDERAKEAKAPDKGLTADQEWAARSRCDQAEMLLRLGKSKEAREAVLGFATDKLLRQSRYQPLGLYYHGLASFNLDDLKAAGKSLSLESVLGDEVHGIHARYLLARVFHLNTTQNEREEARTNYKRALDDYDTARKRAVELLRQFNPQKDDQDRKARLERLVKGPKPDYIVKAKFFLGVLQYEDGRFGEAMEQFKGFIADHPSSPLAAEAKLRIGYCQVQSRQSDDALKTLSEVLDKEPALADQAMYYAAKALLQKADPTKVETYKSALETFRKAADRANQRATGNPPDLSAKVRRGEILADLAETQQQAKQYKDAAATYAIILQDKLLPAREDEVLLNQATAQQLAGDYSDSEKTCVRFLDKHKDSTLLPAVLFRQAENSGLSALAAEKNPNVPDRAKAIARHNEDAISRYTALIEKYPEYPQINLARHGLGMAWYRKGDLVNAEKALSSVPAADRSGDLASVSYNLADIALRTAAVRPGDDAIATGKMIERLQSAANLLDSFLGTAPDSPEAPDALLKIGYCQQRIALLQPKAEDRQRGLAAARSAYEKIQQKYPRHELAPQASVERAKVMASQGDANGAMNELKKFAADPLKKTSVAPLAMLQLATLHRRQNRPADAATTLAEARKEHETALRNDPTRSSWVALLQYHHAAALREAGKLEDARLLFDQIAREVPNRSEGWDAGLRAGQCQKENGEKKIADALRQMGNPGLKPDQKNQIDNLLSSGVQDLQNASSYLVSQEQSLRTRKADDPQKELPRIRSRMLYEAAWASRALADREIESARKKIQLDRWQKRKDDVARATPSGQTPPAVGLPEVDRRETTVQPAETQARTRYRDLIKTFPDLTINADARFELAELLAMRNEHQEAIQILQGALEAEKEPSPELTDRIKVRLGASLLDRGSRKMVEGHAKLELANLKAPDKVAAEKLVADGKKDLESALEQLQTVTGNDKSKELAEASYREAECQLQLGKTDDAIKLLSKFRDHGPFQGISGLSDRALLRLGTALADQKKWDVSRQAHEILLQRFGNSPWRHEARYGIGWAYQNAGQYDNAINAYAQVTNSVSTKLAAKAQLNVGLCRMAQKRYADAATELLVVPYTYNYPELSALSLLEAARAMSENKQKPQAVRLLQRVMRDHKDSAQAEAARKRLAELGEG